MEVASINSESRTHNLKKQVVLSIGLRGVSILLNFYVVRITLDYLGKDFYGIWIVLLSIISWVTLFDIGIANGLRNKLTISLSRSDILDARKNISTAYISVFFISLVILILLAVITFQVNWPNVFNSRILSLRDYQTLLSIFFFSIAVSFILSLINAIFNAFQMSSLTNLPNIAINSIFIILVICWGRFIELSITELMIAYGIAIISGNLLVSIGFFAQKQQFIPRISDFSKEKIRDILSLGGQFFIIQIAVLLIFTTDNFLILQMLGAEQVTVYNIVFKLFSLFTIGFGIIITPLWSAFTEAKEKRDFIWMKNAITRLNRSLILVVVGLIILSLIYQLVLDIWLPKEQPVRPPFDLILSFCVFIIISVWNNIYAFFLNGIGIVKIQVKTAIAGAILNIPLAVFFVKFLNLGLSGVVLAMSGSLFIFSIFGPIFTYRYLNKNVPG